MKRPGTGAAIRRATATLGLWLAMGVTAAAQARPAAIPVPDVGSVQPGGLGDPGGAEGLSRLVPQGALGSREGWLGVLEGLARATVAGAADRERAGTAAWITHLALRAHAAHARRLEKIRSLER